MTSGLYWLLGQLEQAPVLDTMAKEVVGINTPKIAMTRSDTERMDVAISEIGNTIAFGAGGTLADQAFKKVFETAQQAPPHSTAYRWAVLGRSLGIYSVIFSMMWAMPFIRNYITASQTGHVKFTEVIESGKGYKHGVPANHSSALQETLAHYRNQALSILGLGAAAAALAVGFTHRAASSTKEPGKKFLAQLSKHWVGKNLLLDGGKFAKFGGWPALLFWGVPAYGGWLHASRDPYEKKEQALKFVNFAACFFGPSVLMNRWFQGKFEKAFPTTQLPHWNYKNIQRAFAKDNVARDKALKLWGTKNLFSLGSSILLLGTMPQLINIYLTKQRIQRDFQAKPQAATQHFNGYRQAPYNAANFVEHAYTPKPIYAQSTRQSTPFRAASGYTNAYGFPAQFQQPLVF